MLIIHIVGSVTVYLVTKNAIPAGVVFYLFWGFHKSRMWLGLRERRGIYLPPMIQSVSFKSLVVGTLLWPIVIIGGDPMHDYFADLQKNMSGRQAMEHFERLDRED
jgi:hypothetical protein